MRTERARRRRRWLSLEAMEPRVVLSVTIQVRYDYDTAGFFASAERRQAMEAAAVQIGSMLQDHLAAITPSGSNSWTAMFDHPVTGQTVSLNNLVVPANTIIVFAAGADLPGSQTGEGGPGGWSASGSASWFDVIRGRGQSGALASTPTDFAPWGGLIRFDTVGTNWFFGTDSTAGLTSNKTDFLTVASHELGHLLGIGTSDSWNRYVNSSGSTFVGPASVAANGGAPVPLVNAAHWSSSVTSEGSSPAMTAVLMNGTRTPFTALDRAALTDIGWVVNSGGTGETPSLSLAATNPSSVSEGAGTVTLQVVRSSGEGESTVAYTIEGISATVGVDLLGPASGVLHFAPGQTTAEITLSIVDDSLREGPESFQVVLSNPTGATLGEWMAGVTIVDNERRGQGDFDGDGKADLAVVQASNSQWLAQLTGGGILNRQFGSPRWGTLPVPADYDGDGKTDLAVFRPSDARWLISLSGGASINKVFGRPNLADLPVPADYDGDGKADLAVFRVAEGRWLVGLSGGGSLNVKNAATNLSQIPVPADYDGDGKADLALFQPANGTWIIPYSSGGRRTISFGAPRWQHVPVPADYDGDGKADLAVFVPSQARWLVSLSGGGTINRTFGGKSLVHVPLHAPIAAMRRLGLLR